MRFLVRSLGGKLIACAALTLLLCMLLFSVMAWGVLKYFSEREATSDARAHLELTKQIYQTQNATLLNQLTQETRQQQVVIAVSHPSAASGQAQLVELLTPALAQYRLSTLDVLSTGRLLIAHLGDETVFGNNVPFGINPLVDKGLQGNPVSSLQLIATSDSDPASNGDEWVREFAVPIRNAAGVQIGLLLATQSIDDHLALDLVEKTGFNVVLCESKQVLATSVRGPLLNQPVSEDTICNINTPNIINSTQHYLTLAESVPVQNQLAGSPSLVIVDVEALYNLDSHIFARAALILILLGVFVLTLGVIVYAIIARHFFIRPLRQLQARVRTLIAENASSTSSPSPSTSDELTTLARSFNLISDSLHIQESESQAITRQLSDLLAMSDMLISTLNLEHLLGELVFRLGSAMHSKSVSLLLYGRQMLSPWAVAQWSDQSSNASLFHTNPSEQHGTVTVHTDPDRDITMTATTKLAAMPAPLSRPANGNGNQYALRTPKLTAPLKPYGQRRPRIPRPALRDLDMILARKVMQKQKIAYGEDISRIYQESGESWAYMALEAGYRSVIAVPLLLQEQAIGAIMLYDNYPYQVNSRDTFLLSTAAIQAAIAIQNALLFAEVTDKNAALERVNNLKSQFLANVTHELRTPLHSIISYGALILEGFVEGELTAEQESHIQFIVRRAEDLSHLVDDMLDLSKIEADHLEVKVEPLSLQSSLTEVVNQLKPIANNKGLYLSLKIEDALPMALADGHRTRQVVLNMVSNALKFTEKGGVTIQCKLLAEYNMLRIAVSDTGIGISPAALDFIFEAFRQADGSTTRRFGGTGLGLTIARKLIELQGGEVAVESMVGHGSTFSFTMPVAPA